MPDARKRRFSGLPSAFTEIAAAILKRSQIGNTVQQRIVREGMIMTEHSIVALGMGAAIGYTAAEHRGFSPLVGVVCGAWMGPLFAWVLFAIDGIVHAHERQRCAQCCEWMNRKARVCPHCGRPVASVSPAPGGLRLVYSRRD
jgi:hypothetical protein